jgi:hypothetical protein
VSGFIKEYQGVFRLYFVSETAQVELRSGRCKPLLLTTHLEHPQPNSPSHSHLGVAAQVEFESRIEAQLKAVYHILVSSD